MVFFNQDFLFFILFFFLSFHFHPRFISFFLFSFSCFSPPHKTYSLPFFNFLFHLKNIPVLHIREREREKKREREREKERERERSAWASTACISTVALAATPASPLPLVVLPTDRFGSDRLVFFFSFFFSYLLVLIQLYFKNWILFCVLYLDYVRNRVRSACSFFFFVQIQLYFKNQILFCVLCLDYVRNGENERKKKSRGERKNLYNSS